MACNGSLILPNGPRRRIAYIAAFFSVLGCVWLLLPHLLSPKELYRRYYRDHGWRTEDELRALVSFTSISPRRSLGSLDLADGLVPYTFGITTKKDVDILKHQLRGIDVATPIIIYSKTYCSYSKRAKALFEKLDVEPKPVIIEVDLREDADIIKAQLSRLTGRATFPNILLRSKSIGGFTDIQTLYESGQLLEMLADEHIGVRGV